MLTVYTAEVNIVDRSRSAGGKDTRIQIASDLRSRDPGSFLHMSLFDSTLRKTNISVYRQVHMAEALAMLLSWVQFDPSVYYMQEEGIQ